MQSVQPSTLCKDIFELEKDFRYNLFLLKLRDAEITRCKTQNEQLLNELKQKDRKNAEFRVSLHSLETQLTATNSDKAGMKIYYDETIANLSSQLENSRKSHNEYVRQQQSQIKKRESDIEKMFHGVVEAKQNTHQQEIMELNARMQKEKCLIKKAKNDLENVINENISLRTELQEKQSYYISKISILESELKTVRDEKVNAEIKFNAAQKDCQYFETELKKTITEKDQVKQELSDSDERNRNSRRKLNEISDERDQLKQELKQTSADLKTCFENLQQIKEENCQYQSQFECFKNQQQDYNNSLNNLQQNIEKNAELEKQLENMNIDIKATHEKCNILKQNYAMLQNVNTKLILKMEFYKQQILIRDGTNYLRNFEKLTEENLKYSAQIEQYKQDHIIEEENLQLLNDKLIEKQKETDNLKKEFNYYMNQSIDEIKKCTIPDHGKIDVIIKQNSILQEIVKSLRRERSQALDAEEMERKIERLEHVVARFKASILNSVSSNDEE